MRAVFVFLVLHISNRNLLANPYYPHTMRNKTHRVHLTYYTSLSVVDSWIIDGQLPGKEGRRTVYTIAHHNTIEWMNRSTNKRSVCCSITHCSDTCALWLCITAADYIWVEHIHDSSALVPWWTCCERFPYWCRLRYAGSVSNSGWTLVRSQELERIILLKMG